MSKTGDEDSLAVKMDDTKITDLHISFMKI
jgi:hypothetical protein